MTTDETNLLQQKAKGRKDGIYSFRGNLWAVKDENFVAFVNYRGETLQRFGAFNIEIGNLSSLPRYEWKNELKKWLGKQ